MEEKEQNQSVFHSFTSDKFFGPGVLVIFLLVVASGLASGYFLVSMQSKQKAASQSAAATATSGSSIQKGAVYGSDDTKTFKDMAEGTMTAGGIQDEGQFHLVRPGGDSQNVYLTSSLVDLSLFLNRKVRVWGQTQKAKVAGWLMDVGRVEVLE